MDYDQNKAQEAPKEEERRETKAAGGWECRNTTKNTSLFRTWTKGPKKQPDSLRKKIDKSRYQVDDFLCEAEMLHLLFFF